MSREDYKLKQQKKTAAKERERHKFKIKKTAKMATLILVGAGAIFGLGLYLVSKTAATPGNDLAICIQHTRLALHIHPHLSITIKGEPYLIPSDIGISAGCMRPIHTHDDTGTLHLEFPYQRDVKLGEFFKVWGRDLRQDFSDGELKMLVNGELNQEVENYIMKDGDKIEIIFE